MGLARTPLRPVSVSYWTSHELLACNITVEPVSAAKFFGHEPDADLEALKHDARGELTALDPDFLNYNNPDTFPNVSRTTRRLIRHLQLAHTPVTSQSGAIIDFGSLLLSGLDFGGSDTLLTLLIPYYVVSPVVCRERKDAHLDVVLITANGTTDNDTLLLLLQHDTAHVRTSDSSGEARLIAGAIAAFQANNNLRRSRQLPLLEEIVFPGIVMFHACPVFYKIPVTRALSEAVAEGTYPGNATRVVMCSVPFQQPGEGMEVTAFRRTALQYFIAFSALAKELWTKFAV